LKRQPMLRVLVVALAVVLLLAGCSPKEAPPPEVTAPEESEAPLDPSMKVPGFTLWITSQSYDPVRYEAGLLMAENWRKLGFAVETIAMEWATMSAEGMKAHKHDAFMCQWGGKPERVDPFHWLYSLHHSSLAEENGYNIAGYINPEYDELADQFTSVMDWDARREIAAQLQEILAHDVPQPPIASRVIAHAYNTRDFEGYVPAPSEGLNSFWNWMGVRPTGDRAMLKFGYVNDVKLLNPFATKAGADMYMLRMLYDPLIRLDPYGEPKEWAAESYREIDATTIEVKLRSGMTFHDGRPVTVEDVKFTYDLAVAINAPQYAANLKSLEEVVIVDDSTLRFKLTEPYAPFISNALGVVLIVPRHIWEPKYEAEGDAGILGWENPSPVGSGPFQLEYWRPNEELKLKGYFDHFQPPNLEELLRIPYAKAYGVVQGLKAGEIDAAGLSLLPVQVEELQGIDHLTISRFEDMGCYMLHYNLRHEPFDNVDVRRALTYAIPKKQIVDLVFEGQAVPVYSVVVPANEFWHNDQVEKVGDDLDKARSILEEAGFRWDEDGRLYYPPVD